MGHSIKTVYVVHHSHTDIGYTDLQERVILNHVNYIRSALNILQNSEWKDFRWNCETWFCVREFLKRASEQEKTAFFELMREERMGFSGTYLNFTDLADCDALSAEMDEMCALLESQNIPHTTAMFADINGISMGQRDVLLNHGIEFLYTNIHTHHGMYPLYQNQNAYWWENAAGKRLLVWNGEHYHLGNSLGIMPGRTVPPMTIDMFGKPDAQLTALQLLDKNMESYLTTCERHGYPYDFIITSVSGVYSDNAPPETEIVKMIRAYNSTYSASSGVRLEMVSLQELYRKIAPKLTDLPVYRGDLTDWWAHGIGSTPYAVKHFRDAQHRYHLCKRLDADCMKKYPELAQSANDNLLLYAEHTWGHSMATIHPYHTMVLNLDTRKTSYASKAHEAASLILTEIGSEKGDISRYYSPNGKIRVCPANHLKGLQPVEFYVECPEMLNASIRRSDGKQIPCQVSSHPRGRLITFMDEFDGVTAQEYAYTEIPAPVAHPNYRHAYVGIERVKDIVNDYDPQPCMLAHEFENKWFKLCYECGKGIVSFVNKSTGKELLSDSSLAPFFTPIYECTSIRPEEEYDLPYIDKQERRILGRNIRGVHAKQFIAQLEDIKIQTRGEIFTTIELKFALAGTVHCSVILKFFEAVPRIDFSLEIGKTISKDIESIFLPLTLDLDPQQQVYLEKGSEAFRPGIDQLPGTGMEYYVTDQGVAIVGKESSLLLSCQDVPLVYMGEMKHHPIHLCNQAPENNRRPVYSWVMNNVWETNFKVDLSGFCEYKYSLYLSNETQGQAAMQELTDRAFDPYTVIIE